jgi:hypothetical protein
MTRFQVFGYYTDEPQVVIDLVDAENEDTAIAKVEHARGGPSSGYTNDGAQDLSDAFEQMKDLMQRSEADVAQGIAELAAQYAHYHEDGDTQ